MQLVRTWNLKEIKKKKRKKKKKLATLKFLSIKSIRYLFLDFSTWDKTYCNVAIHNCLRILLLQDIAN